MKILRLLLIACLFIPCISGGQQRYYVYGVFENYFPFSPFETTFSALFKNLNSDPQLLNKSLHKRTDTSLFAFSGNYDNYDRGILRKTNVEIKLNEVIVEFEDSLNTKDTFFQYQVVYDYNSSNAGPGYVKKIFSDFGKEYHGSFTGTKDFDIKDNNTSIGLTRNYFIQFSPVSPLTVGWVKINNNESIFTIAVRFKLIQDELIIYVPELKKSP